MKNCKVNGCDSGVHSHGYCERHSRQIKKYGKIVSISRSRLSKNEIIERNGFAELCLYDNFGNICEKSYIDFESVDEIKDIKWHVSYGYVKSSNGIFLHRLVFGEKNPEVCIDHINRNTLDNRIANLRSASKAQNTRNSNFRKSNTSGFKGVVRSGTRWRAQIKVSYKSIHIGRYEEPEDAAKAYDEACLKHHGEFASTNASMGLL